MFNVHEFCQIGGKGVPFYFREITDLESAGATVGFPAVSGLGRGRSSQPTSTRLKYGAAPWPSEQVQKCVSSAGWNLRDGGCRCCEISKNLN